MRIAMIGTRGVPARYGGFETCVEEVGRRLAARGHEVVVYCRSSTAARGASTHLGMKRVELPSARRRSLETLSHTAVSVVHLGRNKVDAAFVFNSANSPFLPLIRSYRIPVATHVDGLEWRRSKWSGLGKAYYRSAESLAVRWSDAVIADAQGIANYYREEFSVDSELISYGAPLVLSSGERLGELGLQSRHYHLVVARFEPENHVREIVKGYVSSRAKLPLVVVGSAPYSDIYTADVQASADDRVRFLGGLWDQELLDQLYANCLVYVHGHSVGGTNPSLLRAIGAGGAVVAFDVNFNREVLGEAGEYFRRPEEIAILLEDAEARPEVWRVKGDSARARAKQFDWDDVADKYEALAVRLVSGGGSHGRASGRRRRSAG